MVAAAFLAAQACRFTIEGPAPIYVSADAITLAWDAPASLSSSPQQIVSWRVYARPHGSLPWNEIDEVAAEDGTSYTLWHDAVGDGSFDLAVAAVDQVGRVSVMADSTSVNAEPVGGWYVAWRRMP